MMGQKINFIFKVLKYRENLVLHQVFFLFVLHPHLFQRIKSIIAKKIFKTAITVLIYTNINFQQKFLRLFFVMIF